MKKSIKTILSICLCAILPLGLLSCGKQNDKKIIVGASPIPHAEILEAARPILKKQGYTLEIVEFQDYVLPNTALQEKSLDANFFQHVPYLEAQKTSRKLDFTYTAKIHIERLGIYSHKLKSLCELKNGAEITIPNDETNRARALKLLEKNSLIKLKNIENPKIMDISENPKSFKITEIEAAQLPRTLTDVAVSVINTNYALSANLISTKDALAIEGMDSPYANVLVCRTEDKNSEKIRVLTKALTSIEVKKFIENKYRGSIVPTF